MGFAQFYYRKIRISSEKVILSCKNTQAVEEPQKIIIWSYLKAADRPTMFPRLFPTLRAVYKNPDAAKFYSQFRVSGRQFPGAYPEIPTRPANFPVESKK